MRRAVVALLLLSACTASTAPTTPEPSAARPTTQTKTAAPSATVLPSTPPPSPTTGPAASTAAFPDLSLVAATSTGEIYVLRGGQWMREAQVCPDGVPVYSGSVLDFQVAAGGGHAWFRCDTPGPPGQTMRAFVYDFASKTAKEVFASNTEYSLGPISPDGRRVILALKGDCEPLAPVCRTKRVMLDVQTGERREILPDDYWAATEMRWTSFGLTYARAACWPAGCEPDQAKLGTFRWDGSTWKRISADRMIEERADSRMLLERRRALVEFEDVITVLERAGTAERVLTQLGVSEFALGLDARGATTFRPDRAQGADGTFVRYEGGREVSTVRGRFWQPRARSGDWVLTVDYNTLTGTSLWAYSLSQGIIASMRPTIRLVAIAGRG